MTERIDWSKVRFTDHIWHTRAGWEEVLKLALLRHSRGERKRRVRYDRNLGWVSLPR